MIVGMRFNGDEDTKTAWQQHDQYGDALRIIVDGCRAHIAFAVALLEVAWPLGRALPQAFDHRCLQETHDILAAVWRYRANFVQPEPPLPRSQQVARTPHNDWLEWLRVEVDMWRARPRLIVLVATILANQNKPAGYQAEDELQNMLLERFTDVPWLHQPPSSQGVALPVRDGEVDADKGAGPDTEDDELDGCECGKVGRPPCGQIPCRTLCARAAKEGWGPLE